MEEKPLDPTAWPAGHVFRLEGRVYTVEENSRHGIVARGTSGARFNMPHNFLSPEMTVVAEFESTDQIESLEDLLNLAGGYAWEDLRRVARTMRLNPDPIWSDCGSVLMKLWEYGVAHRKVEVIRQVVAEQAAEIQRRAAEQGLDSEIRVDRVVREGRRLREIAERNMRMRNDPDRCGEDDEITFLLQFVQRMSEKYSAALAEHDVQLFPFPLGFPPYLAGRKALGEWQEVCMMPNGCMLYRRTNGVGGYLYGSDEVGEGVVVWDTSVTDPETLLFALVEEKRRQTFEEEK